MKFSELAIAFFSTSLMAYSGCSEHKRLDVESSSLNDTCEVVVHRNTAVVVFDSIPFCDSVLHGVRATLLQEDSILTRTKFIQGQRQGETVAYYPNSSLKYLGMFRNDKRWGEWQFYYKEGGLRTYEMFDNFGERSYLRKYDEKGDLISFQGDGISYVALSDSVIDLGNKVFLQAYFAKPPRTKLSVYVSETVTDEGEPLGDLRMFDVGNSTVVHGFVPSVIGELRTGVYWMLTDSVTGEVERDMKIVSYQVR